MNEIVLRGYLRDIGFSHFQGNVEYEKANLICPRTGGKDEDVISLRYKKYANKYKEGDFIELTGNIRSYSSHTKDKNSVQLDPDKHNEEVKKRKNVFRGCCKWEL